MKLAVDKWLYLMFGLSLLFVGSGMLWLFIALEGAAQPLIVHFNNVDGITKIGTFVDIFWIVAVGVFIVGCNFAISFTLKKRDPFLAYLLAAVTLFLALLLFIGLAAIINAN